MIVLLFLLLSFSCHPSNAIINDVTLVMDQNLVALDALDQPFGFFKGGSFSLEVSSIVSHPYPYP